MNEPRKLSLLASRKLIRDIGVQDAFDKNPDEIVDLVRLASAEQGMPVDISEARDANLLRKARAWTSEKTADATNTFVREPLMKAFGDNPYTRVISGAVEGIAQSAPELALMALTRGRGPLVRPLGTAAAGVGSGIANYNETLDPTSAVISGGTMAALPTTIRAGQVAASGLGLHKLPPLVQRAISGGIGAGAGFTGDLVDLAYRPEMEEVSLGELGSTTVPTERVHFTDFGKAVDRLNAINPTTPEGAEQLATLVLSEAGPGIVGLAMDKAARRKAKVAKAQQEIIPLNSEQSNPINFLTGEGKLDVPAAANKNTVDLVYNRYLIEGEPSRIDLQYYLYNNVPESSLTPAQLEMKRQLSDPALRATLAARNIANYGNQVSENTVNLNRWKSTLADIKADIDPNYDPTYKGSKLSEALDQFSRTVFDAPQNVDTNPVARTIQELLQRNDTDSDRKTNDMISRLGTIDGKISAEQASHNLRQYLNDYLSNKDGFADKLDAINLDRQKKLQENPSIYNDIPVETTESLIKNHGLTPEQAAITRNIHMMPTFLAIDSFNTNNAVLTNRLAAGIMDSAPHIKSAHDAYTIAESVNNQAKVLVGEAIHRIQAEQAGYPSDVKLGSFPDKKTFKFGDFDKQQASKLSDFIWKNIYNSDPSKKASSDRLGISMYRTMMGITMQYAHNKAEGYMPLVRRGKYKVSWTDANGEKLFRGFNDKREFEDFKKQLKDEGSTNINDYTDDYKANIDAAAFDQVSEIRRSIMEAREELNNLSSGVASVSDVATDFLNSVYEATKVFEDQYRNVARTLSQADLLKTTTLERRNVGGINPKDLLPNLLELTESIARANAHKLNHSQVAMLLHDPAIRNNKPMLDYFEQRRKYLSNPDAPEWIPIRNLTSLNYLAGSTSFISQNATQPYMLGAPLWKTHTGRSVADFVIASKRAIETLYNYENDPTFSKVDPTIQRFMRRAVEDGVFNQSATDETFARRRLKTNLSDIAPSKATRIREGWNEFMKWASQVISGSEEMNRKTSFLQFLESENRYKPLRERTAQDLESVYARARQFSEAVNFKGGKSVRPGFIMNLAGADGKSQAHGAILTALSLTNFQRNMFGILFNRLRDAIPGLRDRKAIASLRYKNNTDRLALVKVLGVFGTMAGAMGVPLVKAFDDLAAKFGGEEERPTSNIRERLDKAITTLSENPELGRRVADMFMYGVPGFFGWNQQNVGMNQLMPVNVAGETSELFGAPGQLAENAVAAAKAAYRGDVDSFIRASLPTGAKAFKNTLDALTRGTIENTRGEAVVPEGTLKDFSALAMLTGGAPTEVSNQRNALWNANAAERSRQENRRELVNLVVNNLDYPERMEKTISAGIESGLLSFNSQDDVNRFMMSLAERSLHKRFPTMNYNSEDSIPALKSIYAKYGISPDFMQPVQQTIEAIKIARTLNDPATVVALLKKFENDSMILRDALIRKGVSPDIVSRLLKPELNQNDVDYLQQNLLNASTENLQSF